MGGKKLNLEKFLIFNQQFITLIKAGLPILKALASDPDPDISEAAKDSLETVQEQPAQPN